MTLNGVLAVIMHYFTEIGTFRGDCVTVVEVRSIVSAPKT